MTADVAIRLGLKGGTEVERGLKQVGREGKVALRELQDAARGLPPHMVAVSRGVAAVRDTVDDWARRAPGAMGAVAGSFGFLGTAIAAVTAAVGLMAVAMVRGAVAAANTGDEIATMANRIGVSTTALQQLRDAGLEADVEIGEMDAGLQGLNASLGAMKSGVGDAKLKEAFGYLGFTPDQLAGFKDASDLLPVLADRLALVGDKAERVQLAKKLGAENLLPFLELGSARIRELMQAASDAGRVIDDELIERLAASDREMEKVDAKLKVASTTFWGQFTPAVADAKGGLAGLLDRAVAMQRALDALGRQADKDAGKFFNLADAARRLFNFMTLVSGVGFIRAPSAKTDPIQEPAGGWATGAAEERQQLQAESDAALYAKIYGSGPTPAGSGGGGQPGRGGVARGESAEAARKRAEAEAQRAAELAKQNAERLRALDLENRLAQARAAANVALIKKLEEETALYALIARYQAAGVDADTARLAAQIQLRELRAMEAETVKVDANPEGFRSSADRMADIGPVDLSEGTDWTVLRDRFKTSFRDGVRQALETGDVGAALAAQVEYAFIDGVTNSLDRLADMLFDLFEQAVRGGTSAGGASGGGIWDQLAGFIGSAIGGAASTGSSVSAHAGVSGRATGGPVWRGWSGMVGEQGRERFTAAADGYIADAATTARQMTDARPRPAPSSERGSGGGGGEAVTVNLNNQTGVALQARATERRDPATGGRHLDVELFEMIDARIDQRFKSSLRGRRDDSDWAGQFGIRRRLTGG